MDERQKEDKEEKLSDSIEEEMREGVKRRE